jgi:hypothetical protein
VGIFGECPPERRKRNIANRIRAIKLRSARFARSVECMFYITIHTQTWFSNPQVIIPYWRLARAQPRFVLFTVF